MTIDEMKIAVKLKITSDVYGFTDGSYMVCNEETVGRHKFHDDQQFMSTVDSAWQEAYRVLYDS